jgi:RNA polymerase sigma-70 factor, ECF subfamily
MTSHFYLFTCQNSQFKFFIVTFVGLDSLNNIEISALVGKVKTGDQNAFAEVYDRYSGAINGVINRFITDADLAQDVLQDTFIKVWKNIQMYDDTKGSFFTWMLNIARNTSIDALRKLKKEGKSEIQILETTVNSSTTVQQNVSTIGLRQLVDRLPAEQQTMIEYLYFKGYTQQEVADELEIPLGTVKTRSRMAMMELRKWFTLLILWI